MCIRDRYYICRLFKKHTGYTLNNYIVSKRLERARYLLGGDIPITDISIKVGFYNYSYFYKAFKTFTGLSPAAYRDRLVVNDESAQNGEKSIVLSLAPGNKATI
ncbi:MAG: helix-turn-helix domain-containing protein, partial [Clostridiales bacterium]|nr:helix-turn-helix domain-containing protein [Clostridiales bacterium]